MSVNIDNIEYYEKNVLKEVKNWNILSNTNVSGETLVIGSAGYCGYDLVDTYYNGLKACRYRSINLKINLTSVEQKYNYENYIEVILKGKYTDSNGYIILFRKSINATYLNSSLSDNGDGTYSLEMSREITMPNFDFENCTVFVSNHTNGNVILTKCVMKRSQDISSSQVGGSIGFDIALSKVIAYTDGCEIYFDGDETPMKMWWQGDESGNLTGVNVNNERLIKFERKSEILID